MSTTWPPGHWDPQFPRALAQARQLNVGTKAVNLLVQAPRRISATIKNNSANIVYVGGDEGVTTATGHILGSQDVLTVYSNAALWAIAASATNGVSVIEELGA